MTELMLKIEAVNQHLEAIDDYRDLLIEISRHDYATQTLTDALMKETLAAEKLWQEIERRDDYKIRYVNRDDALKDFLHQSVSGT